MKEFLSKFIIYILHNDIIRGEMPWKRFHIFQIAPAVTKTIMSMSSKKAWLNWLQVQYDYSYWRRSDNLDWLQSIFSLGKSETRCLPLSIVKILHQPFFPRISFNTSFLINCKWERHLHCKWSSSEKKSKQQFNSKMHFL